MFMNADPVAGDTQNPGHGPLVITISLRGPGGAVATSIPYNQVTELHHALDAMIEEGTQWALGSPE